MIQANELRLGNLVLLDNGINPAEIKTVDFWFMKSMAFHFDIEKLPYTTEINGFYKPIPLTPELLEKVGFTKSVFNQNKYYKDIGNILNDKVLWINLENKDAKIRSESAGMLEFIYPNHLHQLQNLFWCLTGEELTINL